MIFHDMWDYIVNIASLILVIALAIASFYPLYPIMGYYALIVSLIIIVVGACVVRLLLQQ